MYTAIAVPVITATAALTAVLSAVLMASWYLGLVRYSNRLRLSVWPATAAVSRETLTTL